MTLHLKKPLTKFIPIGNLAHKSQISEIFLFALLIENIGLKVLKSPLNFPTARVSFPSFHLIDFWPKHTPKFGTKSYIIANDAKLQHFLDYDVICWSLVRVSE